MRAFTLVLVIFVIGGAMGKPSPQKIEYFKKELKIIEDIMSRMDNMDLKELNTFSKRVDGLLSEMNTYGMKPEDFSSSRVERSPQNIDIPGFGNYGLLNITDYLITLNRNGINVTNAVAALNANYIANLTTLLSSLNPALSQNALLALNQNLTAYLNNLNNNNPFNALNFLNQLTSQNATAYINQLNQNITNFISSIVRFNVTNLTSNFATNLQNLPAALPGFGNLTALFTNGLSGLAPLIPSQITNGLTALANDLTQAANRFFAALQTNPFGRRK